MKLTVFTSFQVDADSYKEASDKLRKHFSKVDGMLADTMLVEDSQQQIRSDLGTVAIVNHAKI